MVECPMCKADLGIDDDELDEGDVVSCDECGRNLTVQSLNPIELEEVEEETDEEEEEEFDESDPWKSLRGY